MSLPAQLDPWGAGQSYKWTFGLCSLISHLAVPGIGRIPLQIQNGSHRTDHRSPPPALWSKHLIAQGLLWWTECSKHLNGPHTAPALPLWVLESPSTSKAARNLYPKGGIQVIPFSSLQNGNFQYEYKIWKLKDLLILGLDPKSFLRS